jgi:hypothetical protein
MYSWRVTKYDPSQSGPDGARTAQEWTSVSDLGRVFGGERLEAEAYLSVEDAYVEAVMAFFDESGAPHVRLDELEYDPESAGEHAAHPGLGEPPLPGVPLVENQAVARDDLPAVVRLALREVLWCKLSAPSGFFVHFGYDYYMYLGSPNPSRSAQERARALGLFIEPMPSPYAEQPTESPAS